MTVLAVTVTVSQAPLLASRSKQSSTRQSRHKYYPLSQEETLELLYLLNQGKTCNSLFSPFLFLSHCNGYGHSTEQVGNDVRLRSTSVQVRADPRAFFLALPVGGSHLKLNICKKFEQHRKRTGTASAPISDPVSSEWWDHLLCEISVDGLYLVQRLGPSILFLFNTTLYHSPYTTLLLLEHRRCLRFHQVHTLAPRQPYTAY